MRTQVITAVEIHIARYSLFSYRVVLFFFYPEDTYLCTELSPSWEAANCAAIQEIPRNFKETEDSSSCSQEPSTGPYPEPVQSIPYHPIPSHPISLRSISILSTYLGLTSNIPSTKSQNHFLSLRWFIQGICPGPRLIFLQRGVVCPTPNPKLEDHPLSAVHDCLFNIFAATLHIWRPSPPSATWGRAMPWWQGTHLTWTRIGFLTNLLRVLCEWGKLYYRC
jgi:hypothetical protein